MADTSAADGPRSDPTTTGAAAGLAGPSVPADVEHRLQAALVDLLDRRPTGSVCPSEAARAIGGEDWRALMEPVRVIARRLVDRGQAEITQRGQVVDPSTVTGPIRVRRPRPPD